MKNPVPYIPRKTSTYTVDVYTDNPTSTCDALLAKCPVTVAASGVDRARAFVRFRSSNDRAALHVALVTASDFAFNLHTGYGVNQREVARFDTPEHAKRKHDHEDWMLTQDPEGQSYCAVCGEAS